MVSKKSLGIGLIYDNRRNTKIVSNTDVDWAGFLWDRSSTSGYCVLFGSSIISWNSKKQDAVIHSSTMAYQTMELGAYELI